MQLQLELELTRPISWFICLCWKAHAQLLDSTRAFHDSLLKIIFVYPRASLGATSLLIHCLKQALLAPIPLLLSQLSSYWLMLVNKRFEQWVGRSSVHIPPTVCQRCHIVGICWCWYVKARIEKTETEQPEAWAFGSWGLLADSNITSSFESLVMFSMWLCT